MEERAFWLAWSQLPGIGPILLQRLNRHFGKLAVAWGASVQALEAVSGLGKQSAEAIARARSQIQPLDFLEQHLQENPCFWTPADADYPRLLLETPDPPSVLYYRGEVNPSELQGQVPLVSIVGTRDPTAYGKSWTRRLAMSLTQRGFTVVSGLAEGIDAEAHQSCLQASGRTLAVLGTGVDVVYPWRNRRLYQEMIATGLALSEYPSGTGPDRTHFPRRNRIIAGLSRAVLVMEAGSKSGALITARYANEYGRDIYVLPGSLDNLRSQGCLQLANQGAELILGEAHLLSALGAMPPLTVVESAPPPIPDDLAPDLKQILQTIVELGKGASVDAVPLDAIVLSTNLPPGDVSSALLQLELMGQVVQVPGMRYRRC